MKKNLLKITEWFMKLFVLSLVLSFGTANATPVQEQATKITLNMNNAKIETVLKAIESQSIFTFFVNNNEVNVQRRINIVVKNENINAVLDKLFAQTNTAYSLVDRKIVLSSSQQKDKIIKGIVVDEKGEAIIGANIIVKGTSTGTVSDIDGHFTLNVPVDAILTFTYIGYNPIEISVNGKNSFNIVLKEDTKQLDEVVVVGYGTQKKANLTGAVDMISGEVFENRSVSNISQALQGTVPNLNIQLTDGKPSSTASYNLRGTTSIGQGGSALVLIDGVEGDPAMLNPNDIASISVLKDAASSAIYGSRGTFGVILITTKSPEEGKTKVTYTGNFSMQSPTTTPDYVTDGYEWASHFYEAYNSSKNYSADPRSINKSMPFSTEWLDEFKQRREQGIPDGVEIREDGTYDYFTSTDIYDALYKKQLFSQSHDVSVSGSSQKLNYLVTGRFYDYNGLFKYNTDDYNSYNMRAKGSLQVFDWLTVDNNMEYYHMKYHNPINVGEGGGIWRNIADEGHPTAPLVNPDGNYSMSSAYSVGDFMYGKNGLDTKDTQIKNTTGFTAKFLNDKLRVKGDFTFRNNNKNQQTRRVPVPYSKKDGETLWLSTKYNDLQETIMTTDYLATNIYAEYENTFNEDYYIKGMAGYNYEQSEFKQTSVRRNGLIMPDSENINLALGESITSSGNYTKWNVAGSFFRMNFAYKDRYLLEVNGRYDGSSKFPTDEQWAFFPSGSVGWRVSEEPFWKVNKNLFSDMKLRASYGSLGNGNISPYSFMELLSIHTSNRVINGVRNKYTNAPGVLPQGLTWETATTSNIGLDFGMLNGQLRFTGDAYVRKTTDMYTVGKTLPEVFGASSPKGNYADMTTKGFEISLSYRNKLMLADKPFNYEIRASLADYTSTIDKYNNDTKNLDDYYEGQTVGEIWGYETEGLFEDQADIDSHALQNVMKSGGGQMIWYPGDVKYKDLNGDGYINYGTNTADDPGDRKVIGNTTPRYSYSFSLSGDWNNFFFSASFQGVGKQDWYPSSECDFWGQYNRPYNMMPKWHLGNYWTPDNKDAYLPRYSGYNGSIINRGGVDVTQTRYLQNVAYLRMKNVQIGYNLPTAFTQKICMQNARIYLSGENLFCWSPLYNHTKDFDVASIYGSDRDLTSGTSGDSKNYPLMKSISLGLSITF